MTAGYPGTRQPHGTIARAKTCRCAPCRRARAAYEKKRRILDFSKVDGTGTARRLQALAALGWSSRTLAAHLDCSDRAVQERAISTSPAQRATVAKIRALYNELSMTPGPSTRAKNIALAKGWVPPLAWDDGTIDDPDARPHRPGGRHVALDIDDIAVQRAIEGDRVTLNLLERRKAIEVLVRAADLSDRQIAQRLDVWPETVFRIRKKLGLSSGYDRSRRAS